MDHPSVNKRRRNPKYRTCCFVPMCRTTSTKNPNKIFLTVPKNPKIRNEWMKAARRDPNHAPSENSTIRCCEDHFDLQKDAANWLWYTLVGGNLILKKGVVPHLFECQGAIRLQEQDPGNLQSERQEDLADDEPSPVQEHPSTDRVINEESENKDKAVISPQITDEQVNQLNIELNNSQPSSEQSDNDDDMMMILTTISTDHDYCKFVREKTNSQAEQTGSIYSNASVIQKRKNDMPIGKAIKEPRLSNIVKKELIDYESDQFVKSHAANGRNISSNSQFAMEHINIPKEPTFNQVKREPLENELVLDKSQSSRQINIDELVITENIDPSQSAGEQINSQIELTSPILSKKIIVKNAEQDPTSVIKKRKSITPIERALQELRDLVKEELIGNELNAIEHKKKKTAGEQILSKALLTSDQVKKEPMENEFVQFINSKYPSGKDMNIYDQIITNTELNHSQSANEQINLAGSNSSNLVINKKKIETPIDRVLRELTNLVKEELIGKKSVDSQNALFADKQIDNNDAKTTDYRGDPESVCKHTNSPAGHTQMTQSTLSNKTMFLKNTNDIDVETRELNFINGQAKEDLKETETVKTDNSQLVSKHINTTKATELNQSRFPSEEINVETESSNNPVTEEIKYDMPVEGEITELSLINDQLKEEPIENEFALFCKNLAIQLKEMPLDRALMCQQKIQSLVDQERLQVSQLPSEVNNILRQSLSPYSYVPFSTENRDPNIATS